MIDNYYYKDYSDQYSREKVICLIDNDIKKKVLLQSFKSTIK